MTDREAIRREMLALLDARGPDRSICPSEVARRMGPDWRPFMDDVRAVAADLAGEGRIRVTQGGRAVDIGAARGPVRLAQARGWAAR